MNLNYALEHISKIEQPKQLHSYLSKIQSESFTQDNIFLDFLIHEIIFTSNKKYKQIISEPTLEIILNYLQNSVEPISLIFSFQQEISFQKDRIQDSRKKTIIKMIQNSFMNSQKIQNILQSLIKEDQEYLMKCFNLMLKLGDLMLEFLNDSKEIKNIIKETKEYNEMFIRETLLFINESTQNQTSQLVFVKMLNKIILNGHLNTLILHLFSIIKQKENSFVFSVILDNLPKFHKQDQIIYNLLVLSQKEQNINEFIFKSLKQQQLLQNVLIYKILLSNQPKSKEMAIFLGQNIISFYENKTQIEILGHLLETWSQMNFIQYAKIEHQIFLTLVIKKILSNQKIQDISHLISCLQQGVTSRFHYMDYYEKAVQKSSKIIWKTWFRIMQIKEKEQLEDIQNYPSDFSDSENENNDLKEEKNEEVEEEIKKELQQTLEEKMEIESSDSDEFQTFTDEKETLQEKPKHLYDCILGLRQDENKDRFILALKSLSYILKQNPTDLTLLAEDLITILFKLNQNNFEFDSFEKYRSQALIALTIMRPQKALEVFENLFFSKECNLGDKYHMVQMWTKSIKELSSDPMKYAQNEAEKEESSPFFFEQVKTRECNTFQLVTEYEKDQQKKEEERSQKLLQKSRRWGETRKIFEAKQKGENLQSIQKKDLLIIDNKTHFFINRFHEICFPFFHRIIEPIIQMSRFYKKEIQLLVEIMNLMQSFVIGAQNYHMFYEILGHSLQFLEEFQSIQDLMFKKSFLTLILKIANVINEKIVYYYPNIIEKLFQIVNSQQKDKLQDPFTNFITKEIVEKLQQKFCDENNFFML